MTKKTNEYYLKNREKAIERQMQRYKELSSIFNEWKKGLKCSVCGETDHNCLDFHHVMPEEKELNIPRAVARGSKTVISELKKCVVVCANCHRKVHAYNIPVQLDESLSKSFEKSLDLN